MLDASREIKLFLMTKFSPIVYLSKTYKLMSSSMKSTLKIISIIIVVLLLLNQFSIVIIPMLSPYIFWLLIIAYVMLLLAS